MPQAIPAFASWVASLAATSGAYAAGVYTVAYSATTYALVYGATYVGSTLAIGYGLSALGRAMVPKLGGGNLSAGSPMQMNRDPLPTRRAIYGQTRVSGPIAYAQTTGTNNEYLHLIIPLAGHQVQEIGDVYFGDEVVPLDGSGNATGTFAGLARIKKHLGADSQTADSDLVTESGGIWTTNHRLRGVAYLYVRLKWDQTKFPGGMPNVSAVVKGGNLIYDPRTATYGYHTNAALVIRDYLQHVVFGLNVDPATEIDDASFITAANVCDENVSLAAGGTEKRYTVNGSFELSAEPATVLENLCAAMAGGIVYVGGKWRCIPGAHETPTIELNEDDLRGPISVQTKLSLRETCNRVKATFRSPDEKWQPADATPVTNATYLSEDGGVEIWRDLDLAFVTSHATTQRLEKIEMERTRQDIVVRAPCKLTALRVQAGNVVMLTNARFGWTQKQFLVTGLKFNTYDSQGTIAIGVDLELRETAAAVWDWNLGEETTYDPAPNTNLPDPRTVAVPTSVSVTSSSATVLIDGANVIARAWLQWTAPADQSVQSGGRVHMEFKKSADSIWTYWGFVLGNTTFDYVTDLVIDEDYDFRLWSENNLGALSAKTPSVSATAFGLGTPVAPTGLGYSDAANDVAQAPVRFDTYSGTPLKAYVAKVTWTPSTSLHIDRYHLNCTPTSDTPGPGDDANVYVPGSQNFAYIYGLVVGGQMEVRVRAINEEGTPSAYTSFITVNLTPNYGPGSAAEKAQSFFNQVASNLSDVPVPSTARSNLGLGSAAVQNTSAFLQPANNLSELASVAGARANLGLGSAALLSTAGVLQPGNNLSDLSSPAVARGNLGVAVQRYAGSATVSLVGGAPNESVALDISGHGFTTKPTAGLIQVVNTYGPLCYYDLDHGASTSTNAQLFFFSFDGSPLAAGSVKVGFIFEQG